MDSEPHSLEAISAELRGNGLANASADEIRSAYLGVSMTDICRDISLRSGIAVPPDFVDRVETRLFRIYADRLQPIAGADRLLDRLQSAGIPTAIATGGSLRRMRETLRLGGLAGRFEARAFSADQVVRGKPAPDLFLKAARELDVAPALCSVLEDSPHGIAGARAAGMRAVGFVGGTHLETIREIHRAVLSTAGADLVVDTLDDAFEALTLGAG